MAKTTNPLTDFKKDEKRRNLYLFGGIGLVLVIMFALVIWDIQKNKVDMATDFVEPVGATKDFGIVLNANPEEAKDKVANVTLYEDFSCPHCKEFEESAGGTLDLLRETGKANLEYRPVAFMTQWSKRAGNATMCVLEKDGVEGFKAAHDALFVDQPNNGGDPGNDKLLEILNGAEVNYDEACIKSQKYTPWLNKATEKFQKDEVGGTPAVFVNGKVVDAGALQITQAVDAAIMGQ